MKKLILMFLCILFFCFNVQASNKNFSGFMLFGSPNINNLAPISEKYKGKTPEINLENGNNLKIIIWSHGTKNVRKIQNCTKMRIPLSLLRLKSNKNTYFYFLCSKKRDGPKQGSYIYKRKKEINKILDQLIAKGVKPKNIYLAGNSAGGWASLMSMDRVEKKFNSAIVFAPAFAGPRHEIRKYPQWRKVIRPRQVKEMIKAKKIKALIFAYKDDEYNRPEELIFLKEKYPDTVKLVGYKCMPGTGHNTTFNDCRINKTIRIIQNYFENSK